MQQIFNAKAQRRKDAKCGSDIILLSNLRRAAPGGAGLGFFFASLRLCAFALKYTPLTSLIGQISP
jgi:hypothetical protein